MLAQSESASRAQQQAQQQHAGGSVQWVWWLEWVPSRPLQGLWSLWRTAVGAVATAIATAASAGVAVRWLAYQIIGSSASCAVNWHITWPAPLCHKGLWHAGLESRQPGKQWGTGREASSGGTCACLPAAHHNGATPALLWCHGRQQVAGRGGCTFLWLHSTEMVCTVLRCCLRPCSRPPARACLLVACANSVHHRHVWKVLLCYFAE